MIKKAFFKKKLYNVYKLKRAVFDIHSHLNSCNCFLTGWVQFQHSLVVFESLIQQVFFLLQSSPSQHYFCISSIQFHSLVTIFDGSFPPFLKIYSLKNSNIQHYFHPLLGVNVIQKATVMQNQMLHSIHNKICFNIQNSTNQSSFCSSSVTIQHSTVPGKRQWTNSKSCCVVPYSFYVIARLEVVVPSIFIFQAFSLLGLQN